MGDVFTASGAVVATRGFTHEQRTKSIRLISQNTNLKSLRFVQASSCTRRPKLTDPAQGPALTTTPTDISAAIPSSRDYQRQHNASPATAAARNNDDDDDDEQ